MSSSVERFYGMRLPPEIDDEIKAELVDLESEDLVDGHLSRNRTFFGVIDKTLAGFVVLDDTGDDFWLLDARDTGQLYWQDHETRELSFKLASLTDYRARSDGEETGEDEDERESLAGPRPKKEAKSRRAISGSALCERYQWLVPLLARPMSHHGQVIESLEDLMRSAAGGFLATWKTDVEVEKAFRSELPTLSGDPHLAIYWLLHTSMAGDDERRERTLKAIGRAGPELLQAFVAAFGRLGPEGTLVGMPDFRSRRGRLTYYRSRSHLRETPGEAVGLLRALQIAPEDLSHEKAGWIQAALEESRIGDADLANGLKAVGAPSAGASYLRALLDQRAGKSESPHAEAFVTLVPQSSAAARLGIRQLDSILPLVRDGQALLQACERLLPFDPYDRRLAAAGLHALQQEGNDDAARRKTLETHLAFCEKVLAAYRNVLNSPDTGAAIKDKEVRNAVAECILHRSQVDEPKEAVQEWALTTVAALRKPGAIDLIRQALSSMKGRGALEAVRLLAKDIDGPDHPAVEAMLELAGKVESPKSGDFAGEMRAEGLVNELLGILSPHAQHPRIFDRLMGYLEQNPDAALGKSMGQRLLRSGHPQSILGRLDALQATRAARILIRHILQHPNIHVRNDMGHALYQFQQPGAGPFLIQALEEYGERYADAKGPGKVLSHDQTDVDMMEKVVSNLYSAVRNLASEESRRALIGRLHRERRSFWTMGDSLGSIHSPQVHELALDALRRDPKPRAAAAYAYTLADFAKRVPPLLDLTREILTWPLPEDPQERGLIKYALLTGMVAALQGKDSALVRDANARVVSIEEAPLSPNELGGRGKTPSFFGDPKLRKLLDRALSGKEQQEQEKGRKVSEDARRKDEPRLKISDEELGLLAGMTLKERIFHDAERGVVWFADVDGAFRYFDGYEITPPPFQAEDVRGKRIRTFLKGVERVSDQVTWWDKSSHVREALRYGERVLYYWDSGNGLFRIGIRCADEAKAQELLARLRAYPPEGFAESKPWYRSGKGAVVREHEGFDYRFVHGSRIQWRGPAFGSDEEAFAAFQALQLEAMRDRGAQCMEIGIDEAHLSAEDQTVSEWLAARIRNDQESAVWHLRALAEIRDLVEKQGLGALLRGLAVELGRGLPEAEIRRFEDASEQKIPDSLRSVWKEIGHAQWTLGSRSMRLLPPKEVLARREALRSGGGGLDPAARKAFGDGMPHLDALVVDEQDRVTTVYLDVLQEKGRVFAWIPDQASSFFWERSLGWLLATGFLSKLQDEMLRAAPVLKRLRHGQPYNPQELVRRFECSTGGSSKFWEVALDDKSGQVGIRYGKIGADGSSDLKRHPSPEAAKKAVEKLIAEKLKKGYKEVQAKK